MGLVSWDISVNSLLQDEISIEKGPMKYVLHHGIIKSTSCKIPLHIVFNTSAMYIGHRHNTIW